jgi:hypothetical protein
MALRIVEVPMPGNTVALLQVADLDEVGHVAERVGQKETFDLAGVSGTLEGIARAVRAGVHKVTPSKTTVELGIQLVVKNGKLTGLIVEGKVEASLKSPWSGVRIPHPMVRLHLRPSRTADRAVPPMRWRAFRTRRDGSGPRDRNAAESTYVRVTCPCRWTMSSSTRK